MCKLHKGKNGEKKLTSYIDSQIIFWEKNSMLEEIKTMNDNQIDKLYGFMITKVLGDNRRNNK